MTDLPAPAVHAARTVINRYVREKTFTPAAGEEILRFTTTHVPRPLLTARNLYGTERVLTFLHHRAQQETDPLTRVATEVILAVALALLSTADTA